MSLSIIALNLSEVLSEILDLPWLLESLSLTRRDPLAPLPRLPMLEEEAVLLAAAEGITKLETLRGDF